jgi:glycosyltransferase involved in cell wall biosynthesis
VRCELCPIPEGQWCVSAKHPRYCQLAHNPLYREKIIANSGSLVATSTVRFPVVEPANGRIRVGLVCRDIGSGGAEVWQLALLKALDPGVFSWRGCALTAPGVFHDDLMVQAHQRYTPVCAEPDAVLRLASDCDILVTWAVPDILAVARSVPNSPKIVVVSHSPRESAWALDVNMGVHDPDQWVAVSELAVGAIPLVSQANAKIIWNAVDPDRLIVRRPRGVMLATWGIPQGAHVTGFLGRLSSEKDPWAMVKIAEAFRDDPSRHVVLVGHGHELAGLLKAKADKKLDRLHIVGSDIDAGSVLEAFDVLVVPSHYESFGLTIAEGLWLNRPVVSTEVGIVKLHNWLTTVVPVRADGVTLAKAVLDARAYLRANDFVRTRCSLKTFGRDWTDLLLNVVGHKKKASVNRHLVLAQTRNACEFGSKAPGCGCNDSLLCKKEGEPGRLATRQECYSCIETNILSKQVDRNDSVANAKR